MQKVYEAFLRSPGRAVLRLSREEIEALPADVCPAPTIHNVSTFLKHSDKVVLYMDSNAGWNETERLAHNVPFKFWNPDFYEPMIDITVNDNDLLYSYNFPTALEKSDFKTKFNSAQSALEASWQFNGAIVLETFAKRLSKALQDWIAPYFIQLVNFDEVGARIFGCAAPYLIQRLASIVDPDLLKVLGGEQIKIEWKTLVDWIECLEQLGARFMGLHPADSLLRVVDRFREHDARAVLRLTPDQFKSLDLIDGRPWKVCTDRRQLDLLQQHQKIVLIEENPQAELELHNDRPCEFWNPFSRSSFFKVISGAIVVELPPQLEQFAKQCQLQQGPQLWGGGRSLTEMQAVTKLLALEIENKLKDYLRSSNKWFELVQIKINPWPAKPKPIFCWRLTTKPALSTLPSDGFFPMSWSKFFRTIADLERADQLAQADWFFEKDDYIVLRGTPDFHAYLQQCRLDLDNPLLELVRTCQVKRDLIPNLGDIDPLISDLHENYLIHRQHELGLWFEFVQTGSQISIKPKQNNGLDAISIGRVKAIPTFHTLGEAIAWASIVAKDYEKQFPLDNHWFQISIGDCQFHIGMVPKASLSPADQRLYQYAERILTTHTTDSLWVAVTGVQTFVDRVRDLATTQYGLVKVVEHAAGPCFVQASLSPFLCNLLNTPSDHIFDQTNESQQAKAFAILHNKQLEDQLSERLSSDRFNIKLTDGHFTCESLLPQPFVDWLKTSHPNVAKIVGLCSDPSPMNYSNNYIADLSQKFVESDAIVQALLELFQKQQPKFSIKPSQKIEIFFRAHIGFVDQLTRMREFAFCSVFNLSGQPPTIEMTADGKIKWTVEILDHLGKGCTLITSLEVLAKVKELIAKCYETWTCPDGYLFRPGVELRLEKSYHEVRGPGYARTLSIDQLQEAISCAAKEPASDQPRLIFY